MHLPWRSTHLFFSHSSGILSHKVSVQETPFLFFDLALSVFFTLN